MNVYHHHTIDFETRSAKPIKGTNSVGSWRYAMDKSTLPLCLSINDTGNKKDTINSDLFTRSKKAVNSDPRIVALTDHVRGGGLVEAHNVYFEYCIWNQKCVPLFGWPPLKIEQLRCSAAKARMSSLPGALEAVGQALDTETKKDPRGKTAIQKLCQPRKITENNLEEWPWGEEEEEQFDILCEYCDDDVNTEMDVSDALRDLPESELAVFHQDMRINERGVFIDIEAVRSALIIIEQAKERYESQLIKISDGAFRTAKQTDKIRAWSKANGFILPNLQAATVEKSIEILEDKSPDSPILKVLKIRQILGKSSIGKLNAMVNKVDPRDGRVHEILVYHRARTGRWGGAGIQIQNFPRPTLPKGTDYEDLIDCINYQDLDILEEEYGNPLVAIASSLRSLIRAAPGNKLMCADYSSIEARVLVWMAQDRKALQIFYDYDEGNGPDIYCVMAAEIYNIPLDQVDKDLHRPLGKVAILGLGYQMGWEKFIATCRDQYGITIDAKTAKRVVKAYRKKFKSVVKMWCDTEAAALKAMWNPGKAIKVGRVSYKRVGDNLHCRLPSGRKLTYWGARIERVIKWGEEKDQLTYMGIDEGKWRRINTYGGKLVENNDQAISRDLMAHGMQSLEAEEYWVTMTIHDEVVAEVEEDFGNLKEFERLMAETPSWARGLPVEAKGWEGQRYRKG